MLRAVRPLVGIPQRLRGASGGGRERIELDPAYARALAEAGALPVHLAWPADPEALATRLDALVIPGGPDFLTESLGEGSGARASAPEAGRTPGDPPEVRFDPVDPRQLAFDRALAAAALERGIPVLGICYGMQLLALHAGACLHLHLPRDLPAAGSHGAAGSGERRHPVRLPPGTLLARVLGAGETEVNSSHHQAVADPGPWRVAARAPDGVVEAVEPPDAGPGRFCLGVQWHPERMEPAHRRALFGALVEACGTSRSRAPRRGAAC